MDNKETKDTIRVKKINKSLTLVKNIMGIPLYAIGITFVIYGLLFLLTFSFLVIVPFILQLLIFKLISLKDPHIIKFMLKSMFNSNKIVP